MEIWIGKHILIQILNIYWHQILLKVYFWSVQMLIKFLKNRYHARHMSVPHQYQMPVPTTSTGPALADQCRTSLSSPTYASTAPPLASMGVVSRPLLISYWVCHKLRQSKLNLLSKRTVINYLDVVFLNSEVTNSPTIGSFTLLTHRTNSQALQAPMYFTVTKFWLRSSIREVRWRHLRHQYC